MVGKIVGLIVSITGSAEIRAQDGTIRVAPTGGEIRSGDEVITLPGSSLTINFASGIELVIGPNKELLIDRSVFQAVKFNEEEVDGAQANVADEQQRAENAITTDEIDSQTDGEQTAKKDSATETRLADIKRNNSDPDNKTPIELEDAKSLERKEREESIDRRLSAIVLGSDNDELSRTTLALNNVEIELSLQGDQKVIENDTASYRLTVDIEPVDDIIVTVKTSNVTTTDADYTSLDQDVVIKTGTNFTTFSIDTTDDQIFELSESYNVVIVKAVSDGQEVITINQKAKSVNTTIIDSDSVTVAVETIDNNALARTANKPLVFEVKQSTVSVLDTTVDITLQLGTVAISDLTVISYTDANGIAQTLNTLATIQNFISNGDTIKITAGDISAPLITITTLDGIIATGSENLTLNISNITYVNLSRSVATATRYNEDSIDDTNPVGTDATLNEEKNYTRLDISAVNPNSAKSIAILSIDDVPDGFLVFYGNAIATASLAQNTGDNGDGLVFDLNGTLVGNNLWNVPLTAGEMPENVWIQAPKSWSGTIPNVAINTFDSDNSQQTDNVNVVIAATDSTAYADAVADDLAGIDALLLQSNADLDFSLLSNLSNIERIDLSQNDDHEVVNLSYQDVIGMTGLNNQLKILGDDANDFVNLNTANGWQKGGTFVDSDGTFDIYTNSNDVSVQLLVQEIIDDQMV